ncbi:MAG: hypothetical protein LBJ91_02235 [Clostridiales Family XIII bacterium]|jgi:4-diphosphocytidyl-2-C-methyl-D-erythritol kinase|nr:hypothetical protein [Clostridiales Family XIII bacterium]
MVSCNVRAHAKVNLSLSVVGKRDDGYHLIKSRMQALSLHDDVAVETADGEDGISVVAVPARGTGAGYGGYARPLPQGVDNLAYDAAKLSLRLWGGGEDGASPKRGIRILIKKRIPMAAGLAGGSSDAAAVMLALARAFSSGSSGARKPIPDIPDIPDAPGAPLGEIIRAGALIGADVPFCVAATAKANPRLGYSGDAEARSSALCEGIGDEMSPIAPLGGWAVLIKPAIELSTPEIYAAWDEFAPRAAREADEANETNESDEADAVAGGNDLAVAAIRTHPLIGGIVAEVRGVARAGRVFMTGSGPTVVALYTDEAEASRGYAALAATYENRADVDAVILSRLL